VIQLAASRGVSTINIVRDRASAEELSAVKEELVRLGSGDPSTTVVLSESEISGKRSVKELSDHKKLLAPPSLGLNCVGGAAASSAMRLLGHGATFVTYGGLSRKPLAVPASALIFKDVRVVGFWLSKGLLLQRGGGKGKGSSESESESESKEEKEEAEKEEVRLRGLASRRRDLDRVAALVSEGVISTDVEKVALKDWRDALAVLRRGGAGAKKQVLVP
jgi:NADPH:quinone reductase-like Zn-dependent oxidoreductase